MTFASSCGPQETTILRDRTVEAEDHNQHTTISRAGCCEGVQDFKIPDVMSCDISEKSLLVAVSTHWAARDVAQAAPFLAPIGLPPGSSKVTARPRDTLPMSECHQAHRGAARRAYYLRSADGHSAAGSGSTSLGWATQKRTPYVVVVRDAHTPARA
ncbi:hypothetical protein CMUS01_10984 [Colletotrichum musicola]|uniref:Uncharacterized protein n=1 Tax=Colletotrichum musicola TaxID=2175873 RepID=A0A8H6K0X7_9PEZI|nr:hypothetical protein CMUS01_10984 [Colletotrichum musicola]